MQVTLRVSDEEYEQYIATPLKDLYSIGVSSAVHDRLFIFRRAIIDAALTNILVPRAKADLRRELTAAGV
jgi:hypothetical protein